MKKIVLVALVGLFALSFTLEAQNNRRDGRQGTRTENRWTAKDRADAMAKQLELTAEETAKVQALFEKQDVERAKQVATQRADRERMAGDREARREAMREAREKAVAENDAELEKIIGKEKVEQWKKLRAERQNDNRQGRRNAPPVQR
ncbi:MAG: hypothetical protein WC914_01600 [Proteiniphilum sp.]